MGIFQMEFHVDTIGRNCLQHLTSGVTIPSSNYTYDPIGNLTHDIGEDLDVSWNNAGKIIKINNPNSVIYFSYSPLGQRQSKTTYNYADYYLHDATGNIMAIYRHTGDTLKLIEKPIYGSSRLGIVNQKVTFLNNGVLFKKDTFSVGLKNYELTDHLGNVTATFRDRKYDNNLDITSFTDYYPFGFPMPNRNNNLAGYRFGFNGQEADNEVYGEKQSYGFEFRNYDARLGRWWGVDPDREKYSNLSPYLFVAGNPIIFIDPDGRKIKFAKGVSTEFKAAFKASIKHLNEHKVGGIASALEKSKRTYYIAEIKDENIRFSPSSTEEGTIYWNPSLGLETDEGAMLSPTTILNHEMAHALTFDAAMDKGKVKEYIADSKKDSDLDYDSKNERWVITRSEQKTAKALGEIEDGQVTRKNHKGRLFQTESSISNKPKTIELLEIEITAE